MTDPQDELREQREANATLRRLYDEQADLLDWHKAALNEAQKHLSDIHQITESFAPATAVIKIRQITGEYNAK